MERYLFVPVFFLILGFLIFVHELGHFLAARRFGILVEEFGIGFPPRIISKKKGETTYSLNLIPLGGFVKLLGEEDPSHPRSFAAQSPKVRLLVLGAGSLIMLAITPFLFSLSFAVPHKEISSEGVEIVEVVPGSPAEAAGIRRGDVIIKVNGIPAGSPEELSSTIRENAGSEISLLLRRGGKELEVRAIPRPDPPPGEGPLGVKISPLFITRSCKPQEALIKGFKTTGEIASLLWKMPAMLIRKEAALAGPIGIAQFTKRSLELGLGNLVGWIAFLSFNLGVINLLPIPGLDGGRIAFVFIELARRGRRISPQKERLSHLVGLLLLLILIAIISYFDILRFIRGF